MNLTPLLATNIQQLDINNLIMVVAGYCLLSHETN